MHIPTSLLSVAIWHALSASASTINRRQIPVKRSAIYPDYGPAVNVGPTSAGVSLIGFSTIFVPGAPPAKPVDQLFLWPGVWDPSNVYDGDLIQTVAESHPYAENKEICGATEGQWCIRPYDMHGVMYADAPSYGWAIDATDHILIKYTKASDKEGGLWTQDLTNLSKKKHLVSYVKGNKKATTFQTGTEMQGASKGSADVQYYYNTTITLSAPDPKFGKTYSTHVVQSVGGSDDAIKSSPVVTSDGGTTWHMASIMLPALLPGTEWKPPGK